MDTGTAAGGAFPGMPGVLAGFGTALRRERQPEGVAAAEAGGVHKGREARVGPAEVRRRRGVEGLGAPAIARRLGIGRASVYRLLGGRNAGAPSRR